MRRLAQKQPSFKDSVTAHSSRDFASKIIGAKHGTECEGGSPSRKLWRAAVGECSALR